MRTKKKTEKEAEKKEIPQLEISSTQISERVRRGMSIKYLVPEAVEAFILKTWLYASNGD